MSYLFYLSIEVLISFILISVSIILCGSNSVCLIILYGLLFVSHIFKLSYFFKSYSIWVFYFQCLRIPFADLFLGRGLFYISHLYCLIFLLCLVTSFLLWTLHFLWNSISELWIEAEFLLVGLALASASCLVEWLNWDYFKLNSLHEDFCIHRWCEFGLQTQVQPSCY